MRPKISKLNECACCRSRKDLKPVADVNRRIYFLCPTCHLLSAKLREEEEKLNAKLREEEKNSV